MPIEDQMSVTERRKYLKRMHVREVAAKRRERERALEGNGAGDWAASQESDALDACP